MKTDEEKFGELVEQIADLEMVALLDWGMSEKSVRDALALRLSARSEDMKENCPEPKKLTQ